MSLNKSRQKCWKLVDQYYSDVPSRMDILDQAISEFLRPSDVLLDGGCGSNIPLLKKYGHRVKHAIGIDFCAPSEEISDNILVILGNLEKIPIKNGRIDIVVSHSVFEHITEPVQIFKELNRVLRDKGKIVFTTPNKYYYSCLISKAIPESVKNYYFRQVFGEEHFDHFPLYYQANSEKAFQMLAKEAGFKILKIEPIRHYPYYLMFSTLAFRIGILYDKLITALKLRWLQSNWLVVMEKQ